MARKGEKSLPAKAPVLCWERAGCALGLAEGRCGWAADTLEEKVGEEAAEIGRALNPKALGFSP